MAQNEIKAKPALPERVRSMEGLGRILENARISDLTIGFDMPKSDDTFMFYACGE